MSFYHPLQVIRPEVMQVGSGRTSSTGDATITFPKPFPSPPKVFLQGLDASTRGIVLDVYDVTTTGFKVKARKVTGISTSTVGDHTHTNPSTSTAGAHKHRSLYRDYWGYISTPAQVRIVNVWGGDMTSPQSVIFTDFPYYPSSGYWYTSEHGDHSHTVGPTGSAGAHSHTADSPTLEVDFFWLAVAL